MNRYEKLIGVLQRVQEESSERYLLDANRNIKNMLDNAADLEPHEVRMCGSILNEVEMKLQEVSIAK